jgi:hypothetical protein
MLIEWLILLWLVPAILVPVVLLGGFAGCSFEPTRVDPPPVISAPTNVTAAAISPSEIDLSWTNQNASAVTFQVHRFPPAPDPEVVIPVGAVTSFPDTGLTADTMYGYKIGVQNTNPEVVSEPEVFATTPLPPFQPTFSAVLNFDQAGLDGWCLVQRIEPARLDFSGTHVRLTVRGSSAGNLQLNKITLAEAAAAGDPFDCAAAPVVVETGVLLTAGANHTTPDVLFDLDRTKPLLVAFEIGSPGNVRNVTVPQSDARMFFKIGTAAAPVAEAEVVDRTGYTLSVPPGQPGTSTVYLVETIEVA